MPSLSSSAVFTRLSLVCGHSPAQTCGRTGVLSFMSFTVLLLSVFASVFQHFIVLTDVLCI